MNKLFVFMVLWMMSCLPTLAQAPMDGGVWKDNTGKHINDMVATSSTIRVPITGMAKAVRRMASLTALSA